MDALNQIISATPGMQPINIANLVRVLVAMWIAPFVRADVALVCVAWGPDAQCGTKGVSDARPIADGMLRKP
jgi:hypothetical protein